MRSAGDWFGRAGVWAVALVVMCLPAVLAASPAVAAPELDGTSLTTGLGVLAAGVLIFRARGRRN
jgi:hypothetical protein